LNSAAIKRAPFGIGSSRQFCGGEHFKRRLPGGFDTTADVICHGIGREMIKAARPETVGRNPKPRFLQSVRVGAHKVRLNVLWKQQEQTLYDDPILAYHGELIAQTG